MINYFNSLGPTLEVTDVNNNCYLEKLNDKTFYELIENKIRALQAHRGSFKTTSIAAMGIILRLLLEPDIRIFIIRKNFTKASEILQTVKQLMEKPEIQELFYEAHGFYPKAIKKKEDVLTYNFKSSITPEGNVNAFGIHQDLTGKHADFILLDDFVSLEDKISKAEREKSKLKLEEIANNILDPGKQMGLIGTPWHKQDAWSLKLCPPILKFSINILNIFSDEHILKLKKCTTPVTYAANYDLRHIASDETLFKNPQYDRWLMYINNGIGHLDKKYFGVDTNALTFVAKKPNGRYQVLGKIWNDHIKNHYMDIYKLWNKYKIGKIYVENNDDKLEATKEKLEDTGIRNVEMYHEPLNKHVKIQDYLLENEFWSLIDFDPETDPEYINQIIDYIEGSEPDDAPDSLSSIGRILIGKKSETKFIDMFQ